MNHFEQKIDTLLKNTRVIILKTIDPIDSYELILNYFINNAPKRLFESFHGDLREILFSEIKGLHQKAINYIKSDISISQSLAHIDEMPPGSVIIDYDHYQLKNRDLDQLHMNLESQDFRYILITRESYDNLYAGILTAPIPDFIRIGTIITELFKQAGINSNSKVIEQIASYMMGLPAGFIQRAVTYAIELYRRDRIDIYKTLLQEKKRFFKMNLSMEFIEDIESFDSLGGQNQLKMWLTERRKTLSPRAKELGIPDPKGVLLVGIQGCGKSLTARSIAGYWKMPLLKMDFSLLFTGDKTPELAFKENLDLAEKIAPVILWLDEIDKLFSRSFGGEIALKRILGTFLTWLQEKKSSVFVVATANNIEEIPPELLRKGRFDEIFFLDLPGINERREIFKIHIKKRGVTGDFDLDHLAKMANFFSGSEIEQVVLSALYKAFYAERSVILQDLEIAIEEMIPFYQTYEEEIKKMKNWASEKARKASEDMALYEMFQ